MLRTPTALLSAYSKTDALRDFAYELVRLGWNLLASSGTKKFLDKYEIPSTDIADMVGEPILGHRVVTLDRRIYAAILARDTPEDEAELKRIGVERIDLVYVDMYPLAAELAKPDCTIASVIEQTDIGGPTLLRAAAKGQRFVLSSEVHLERFLLFYREEPKVPRNRRDEETRRRFLAFLASEAELRVAEYAALSGEFHDSVLRGVFPLAKWQATTAA